MKIYRTKGKNTLQNQYIPEHSGIYFIWSKNELLYIGKTKNLRKRIAQHFGNGFLSQHMFNPEEGWRVSVIFTKDEFDAERLEQQLINLIPTKNNKTKNWFCNQEHYHDWKFGKGFFVYRREGERK